ncbi:hypothetical protein REPUB_Repub13aG0076600 [Reevesia pubescens]
MWHPNVYPDGKVCMSILHPPGDDPYGYELATERWNPLHTVHDLDLNLISFSYLCFSVFVCILCYEFI